MFPSWYCIRTQRRREGIAAATLTDIQGVDVYAPRIRLRRRRAGGVMWMTEALFPGYIFARFELGPLLRHVQSSRGVIQIVHFSDDYLPIDESVMQSLREYVPDDEVLVIESDLKSGMRVAVVSGVFRDLEAVIVESCPAQERVKVLMQILGCEIVTEISSKNILPES